MYLKSGCWSPLERKEGELVRSKEDASGVFVMGKCWFYGCFHHVIIHEAIQRPSTLIRVFFA